MKHSLNSLGRELPTLAAVATTNHAYVHPADLAELGAAAGDLIEITSSRASVVGVAAADEGMKRGVIAMSHSWGGGSLSDDNVRTVGAPTNRLVEGADGTDAITGLPVMSAIPVTIQLVSN